MSGNDVNLLEMSFDDINGMRKRPCAANWENGR